MTNSSENGVIPLDILDDLSSRFIINIPEGERKDPIRLFFQIELAHWFYLDFHRNENTKLKACGMKEFTKHILKHIPSYSFMLPDLDIHYDKWKEYKMSVPTYGAIVLNEDMTKVLLVQSYFEKTSWGFPKGKVNEDEDPVKCAVREVLEETGCDISSLIKSEDHLEAYIMEQLVRLYVVHGIKETEQFMPQTRNEIKCVKWFSINDLPVSKKDVKDILPKLKGGLRPGSFFMVLPFVKKIKSWIQEKKGEDGQFNKRRTRHKSAGDVSCYAQSFHAIPHCPGVNGSSMHGFIAPLMSVSPKPVNFSGLPRIRKTMGNENYSEPRNSMTKNFAKDIKLSNVPKAILSRRKLFENGAEEEQNEIEIVIPRWLNFKLDREYIIKCFDL